MVRQTSRRAKRIRRTPRSITTVFLDIARTKKPRISIGDVEHALRGRSFGPFVIAFSLPNLLPFPPGTSTLLGLPLLIIAWQMAIGRTEVWLPPFLRRQSISRGRYRNMLARAWTNLRRTERMMRPRQWPFAPGAGDGRIGVGLLVLAMLVVIPVPFANWLPALACFCVGVALTARDGLWLTGGLVVGVIALVIFAVVLVLTGAAVMAIGG